ncbi:maleylpyruvate isomerase family mycothiol-dependent enzyme [Natronosporangium hydrolyticum]|uniref:Maleylpyruvate isomerase family mycothiol-dependent enzyme n=1 Tax=Natronosporangium hydrolyticum TaxID=2811111 RepID=A0A895YAP8_9ACTN|nr:maleylpyruvate isomerase family mycothiol-dependent enzyme [Natronosporangium hydrolyticum]QSB14854.1 maleylpyruvate isomerase family mycothiol-dependent enzyme [Natronosporangium hydrolyticum]
MSSVYQSVAAWRQSLESLLRLGQSLPDPAWGGPTECPRWTVKDIYSHLIGGEQWMADGHQLPEQGYEAWVAAPVAARRDHPPGQVLAELRQVYELRRVQLARQPLDPDQPTQLATGARMPLSQLLKIRVLDVWAHEQDVRRAVGQPGNLASPAAAIAGDLFVASLPRIVAKAAQAPPGASVRLTTRGPVTIDVAVTVDQAGKGALVAPGRSATCHLTLGWEAYTRLCCGRGDRPEPELKIAGDRALAERVLAHLTVTP